MCTPKAPDSEHAKLFTIPKAAVQERQKTNRISLKEEASGTVGEDQRESFAEHIESEQAMFKSRTGYVMKKNGSASGSAWGAAKKGAKKVDPTKESKKTGEAWLKKLGP